MDKDRKLKGDRNNVVFGLRERVKEIRETRGAKYKDPEDGHGQLGRIWGAMLEAHLEIPIPPIPPRIVMAMFVAQKMHRAMMDDHVDHFLDAGVYNDMALEQAVLDALRDGKFEEFVEKEKV